MNEILTDIHWKMSQTAQVFSYKYTYTNNQKNIVESHGKPLIKNNAIEDITLSHDYFKEQCHPSGDWIVILKFVESVDYLAAGKKVVKYLELPSRIKEFSKETTIKQFIEWILSDYCHGHFQGLSKINVNKNIFELK